MKRSLPFVRAAVLAAFCATPLSAQQSRVALAVSGDTTLVVRLGPVSLNAGAGHEGVDQLALQTLRVPADGWLRGYRVEVVDRQGNRVPRGVLHHAELVDLGRRDLLRPAYNRVVSAGRETSDLMLPPGMGYPLKGGQELGINAMLHNPTATALGEVYVQATLTMVPATTPGMRTVLNLYAETSFDSTGDSSFDLPAGTSRTEVEFTVPIAGRVIAVGGHMHDYGTRFVVTRADRPDTLYNAVPRLDGSGAVAGMPARFLLGGLPVSAGDRFRMTVFYDNPTGRVLERAGMGTFGVVFAPEDVARWPELDAADPRVARDLAGLRNPHQATMRSGQGQHHHD